MYLLDMQKYWRKQIFPHGRFPEVGKKQNTEEYNHSQLVAVKLISGLISA